MINDQKNMILAIGLSVLVIIGWQYFIGGPQLDKQRQEQQLKQKQAQQPQQPGSPAAASAASAGCTAGRRAAGARAGRRARHQPDAHPRERRRRRPARRDRHPDRQGLDIAARRPPRRSRADQISRDRRSEIAADRIARAVRLAASLLCRFRLGGRRRQQREGADARYDLDAERLRHARRRPPITLTFDNGEGLEFRRVVHVDENYLFTVEDRSSTAAPSRSRSIPTG